jgi:hypothetical protein
MPIDPPRRPLLPNVLTRTGKAERTAPSQRGRGSEATPEPGAKHQLRQHAAELARSLAACSDPSERSRLRQRFLRQVLSQALPNSVARYPDLRGLLADLDEAFEGDAELKQRFERALKASSRR